MILILFAFNCFYYSVFAQSKKEQIQSLNYRIDSLSNIIIVERQEMDKLQNKIQESKSLLQGFESKKDSLSKELNKSKEYIDKIILNNKNLSGYIQTQKNSIDSLMVVIDDLIRQKNIEGTLNNKLISFSTNDYSFEKGMGDFNYNLSQIEKKEKLRIYKSKYAYRDVSLNVKFKSGEALRFYSQSDHDEMLQKHYSYLFEDESTGKLYFAMIDYNAPGSGAVVYSLQELDLYTGEIETIVSKIGGDFFFNESKSYLIVKGWYDSKEYVYDNQLQIVNLGRKETELTIKSVEPIDVKWLANEEFQCVLLKYTMGNNFPYSRIPSKIRTGELKKYKYIYDNWYKQ